MGQYKGVSLYSIGPLPGFPGGSDVTVAAAAGGHVIGSNQTGGAVSYPNAVIWNVGQTQPTNLNSTNFPGQVVGSDGYGTNGTQQVGATYSYTPYYDAYATLWAGSAGSVVNLNPGGFAASVAEGTNGAQQVGEAYPSVYAENGHAMLWMGSAASAVDLSPAGYYDSNAYGTDGAHQVGTAWSNATSTPHAFVWSGSAASAVDLDPNGFQVSFGLGVGGGQQVGYGEIYANTPVDLALLWFGSAASAVNLNPSGWHQSYAFDTNGSTQVGYGQSSTSVPDHALAWTGTAASAIDLNNLLPVTDTWTSSTAYSIDSAGDIFGVAGDASGKQFAVEWSPVPEPATLSLLAIAAGALLARRRMRE